MTVILTDANGEDWTMTANSAGNFWLDPEAQVVYPYTARIVDREGRERTKQTPVSEGDCASCHSSEGANGAPGRLLPP
jgi:mono/diheme cytochrome c family protein